VLAEMRWGTSGRRAGVGSGRVVVHGENFSNANTMHNAGREGKKIASTIFF
jgi:predicted RecA/RadA family phage recombinase